VDKNIGAVLLATVIGAGATSNLAAVAQAAAAASCESVANLRQAHGQIDRAIDRLNHDDRDYGGHRVAAIHDLTDARSSLILAEQYAIRTYGDAPACFQTIGAVGGSPFPWGLRTQGSSIQDVLAVRRWANELIFELGGDERYGGNTTAAIGDLYGAREQLMRAEEFARAHGY